MSLDEFCILDNTEWDFIGRTVDLKLIEESWKKHKLFCLFGIRSVGKSRLVHEFFRRRSPTKTCYVDVKNTETLEALYVNLCVQFGEKPIREATKSDQWIVHIVSIVSKATRNEGLVIFLDNVEDAVEHEGTHANQFLLLLSRLAKGCRRVKIFVTSTMRIQFSQIQFFSHEVKPLLHSEAKELLQVVAPDVVLGEYGDKIAELSEGLPLILLMIGAELKEDDGLLTPKDMTELLVKCRLETLSSDCYPPDDRVEDVYRRFVLRLSKEYQKYLTELDYIPGSFNVQQVQGVLGIDTEAETKMKAIMPIRRRHVLNYDADKGRFEIQGILREVLKANFVIKDLPELQAKYCRTFTDIIKNISQRMGTEAYTVALSEFALEQPNLQKLLGDVEYTREDTYHFFIEIASSCNQLIETYMAAESESFYKACLKLTDAYNRVLDKATVHIAAGSLATNTKGDFTTGEKHYVNALEVLEKLEHMARSEQLASVYQKLGWNLNKRGMNMEAIEFYKKSLNISVYGGPNFETLAMQSFSCMGISLTYLGNFESAERYHKTCLNRRKARLGEFHPFVGATINNIGLLMDQKGDSAAALECHLQALDIKRRTKAPVVSLIASLSNVANAYNALARYLKAHALLDEAMNVLNDLKVPNKDALALIWNTRGKVYAKEGKLKQSIEAFSKTVELSEETSLHGFLFMKRLVNLAEVQERYGDLKGCLKTAREAMKHKEESVKKIPHNTIVIECLQCLTKVYKATGERLMYTQALYDIEAECNRLERVCRELSDDRKLKTVNDILEDVVQKMNNLSI